MSDQDRIASPNAPFVLVAHHWRTPLTVITLGTDTLIRCWDDLAEAQRLEVLRNIHEAAAELGDWIEEVLRAMDPK